MNAPCRKCENRSVGCHVNCERYIDFVNNCKSINERKRKICESTEAYFDGRKRMTRRRPSNGVTNQHMVRQ